jgi:hypothetical protein
MDLGSAKSGSPDWAQCQWVSIDPFCMALSMDQMAVEVFELEMIGLFQVGALLGFAIFAYQAYMAFRLFFFGQGDLASAVFFRGFITLLLAIVAWRRALELREEARGEILSFIERSEVDRKRFLKESAVRVYTESAAPSGAAVYEYKSIRFVCRVDDSGTTSFQIKGR